MQAVTEKGASSDVDLVKSSQLKIPRRIGKCYGEDSGALKDEWGSLAATCRFPHVRKTTSSCCISLRCRVKLLISRACEITKI
ncbi:hypothetical protein TNCV_4973191 [Trichonephila clavipes]|nr:hypothetical protein TNCV_4973191 [Trichonephila clavipes]